VVRRVLALVLLGVVVLVCAALAASESLRNDSMKTASGVTIQFSDSVRVTSWDTATFPTCSPSSGRAESFAFSGGELGSGGQFRVSWTPSTAEITDTEWETTGASTAGSTTGSSAPLTYEQIMAQIAQYPGPDESLYVPAENEQIWLTDLEGHADIYDNDSIKINYAPGFDKSQITRIDVYRNGVKMRFVAALFDALTNEQMKTFDGNPAENTPKSSHTDHAIYGYRYEVSVWSSSRQIAGPLVVRIRSPFSHVFDSAYAYLGNAWEAAVSGTSWDNSVPMPTAQVLALLTKVKSWGYKGVSINVSCWVSDPFSSVVFRLPGVDLTVADWRFTASDEQLSTLLDLAEQAGLDAEVRMQLYVSRTWADQTGDYSASMRPRDVDSFLDSYFELAAHLARIAEQHGAVLFTPFTEMDSIGRETERVKTFYTRLTSVFSGEFSFEESTHHYLDGWGFSLSGKLSSPFAQLAGQFWDWKDPQGRPMVIEWSCWTPRLESQNDQRLSVLVGGMLSSWSPALDYYRAKYPVNTIRFGEIGTYNTDGVARGGDYFYALAEAARKTGAASVGIRDAQEVADIWAAYIISAMAMRLRGLSVWDLELSRGFSAAYNQGHNSFGTTQTGFSPALAVISALLGGEWNP
jgi:hypothetical protein